MLQLARRLSSNELFHDSVLLLLIITALAMGAEATPAVADVHGETIASLLAIVQVLFVIEICIRVLACAPRPRHFFTRFRNSFDFVVVALSLVPAVGALGLIARLFRLARLIRIVSVSTALRSFASGAARGVAALISAFLMLVLLWYVMALAGFYLFAAAAPARWASMASCLGAVGHLLMLRELMPMFAGVDVTIARFFLAVLYGSVLAVVIDILGHLLWAGRHDQRGAA